MTSAWLWCAAGEKEWRCVHAQDSDALLATNAWAAAPRSAAAAVVTAATTTRRRRRVPDLFRPDLQRFPRLAAARVYAGVQRAGDVCFNPSGCSTRCATTRSPSRSPTTTSTVNLGAVLADGARSLTSELLLGGARARPQKVPQDAAPRRSAAG